MRLFHVLGAAALAMVLMPAAGHAQSAPFGYGPHVLPSAPQDKQAEHAPPAALPGAAPQQPQSNTSPAPGSDLPPNQALFAAINTGNIAMARDALNRGAELSAHNELGMTPLDLSVDLGRNNITFLLLSLRGSDEAPPPPPQAMAGMGGHAAPPHPIEAALRRPVAAPPRHPAAMPAPAAAPATPNPAAGFLGFGGK